MEAARFNDIDKKKSSLLRTLKIQFIAWYDNIFKMNNIFEQNHQKILIESV
jgi:hypothetical protein